MPSNKSLSNYTDIAEILDRAAESERGVRVKCHSRGPAINLRQRMYRYRQLLRDQSREVYEVGTPMHNKTPYDGFIFSLEYADGTQFEVRDPKREGEAYVKVLKVGTDFEVEEL